MGPIAIMELQRMANSMDFISEYTLILNPLTGKTERLTLEEAREIINERGLVRHTVSRSNENGVEIYGYMWDTPNNEFRRYYGAEDFAEGLRKKGFPITKSIKALYRKLLFKQIDENFGPEEPEMEEGLSSALDAKARIGRPRKAMQEGGQL